MKHFCFPLAAFILLAAALTTPVSGNSTSIDNSAYVNAADVLMVVSNQGIIGTDMGAVFGYDYGTFYPYTSIANIENGTQIKSPLYAAGLWLGGKVGDDTLVTVAEYSSEYTPGPMASGTFLPDAYTNAAYRVYKLYADSGSTNPNTDYTEWPTDQGAPEDGSGLPLYMADQTLWTVFNDADQTRHDANAGNTDPLGIEVHQTMWAMDSPGTERVIYIKYKLYNKGLNSLTNFYIGFWMDPDIGWREDDKSGCDTTEDIFYNYNADDDDGVYGAAPPAVGARLVHGPVVASPGDTAWFDGKEMANYRNLRLSSVTSYINGADPGSAAQSYYCLTGLLPNGSIQPSGTPFCYPGDPVAGTGSLDQNPTDKKIIGSAGPLTFNPGDSQCVLIKLAIGQGINNLQSVTDLKAVLTAPDDFVTDVISDQPEALPEGYTLRQNYPNPFNPGTTIGYNLPVRAAVRIDIFNVLGQRVRTLVNQPQSAGSHNVVWDGTDDSGRQQAGGVYFYRARLGEVTVSRKMIMIK
jgi:hypothetical protein